MNTIFDIGNELLIDKSSIRDPYLRLIAFAIGRELTRGSAWVTVQKLDLDVPLDRRQRCVTASMRRMTA